MEKEFYNSLSDEVKAKVKDCRSEQELKDVLADENAELSLDVLEGVAGGFCMNNVSPSPIDIPPGNPGETPLSCITHVGSSPIDIPPGNPGDLPFSCFTHAGSAPIDVPPGDPKNRG